MKKTNLSEAVKAYKKRKLTPREEEVFFRETIKRVNCVIRDMAKKNKGTLVNGDTITLDLNYKIEL